jgi:putative phosphoesterase
VLADLRELGPVAAVRGNVDELDLRAELPERAVADVAGLRIGLVHDSGPRQRRHERLRAWFPECQVIVYGHTHWPELALHEGAWIVNPGSPTERRRAPAHTMAVVRDGKPVLVELA